MVAPLPAPALVGYAAEGILRDGATILIRDLAAADRPLVDALVARMGPRSLRLRFLGATRDGARIVRELGGGDPARHVALAAITRRDGRERLVGLGHYVVADAASATAEVAFEVADPDQGRGIGTLLLEHLARLAHQRGVRRFRAVVQADNARMLDVFTASGFPVSESLTAGEFAIEFRIDETDGFLRASRERERRAAAESVRVFFQPRSVAVVGASRHEGTIGRALVDNLIHHGFTGPIYPVNPAAREIAGRPCFPSLAAIGAPVDLAVIAVPAAAVTAAVEQAAAAGARGVVVISAGFAESSAAGKAIELRLRDLVRGAGLRMVGPNCMGVLSTAPGVRLDATFSPGFPPAGNVSMLSQSGALGLALLDFAAELHIGIADFASIGNKADVSSNDLLAYWQDDPRTQVIGMYLESVGNPRRFARLAPEVSRKKPIVAVKSGRSAAGTRAAASHSAAMASLDVGVDALFAQAGVIRTATMEELFDVVAFLSSQPAPLGSRVGVVTNAGGPGILFADACEAHGLSLPPLAPATVDALRALLPAQAGLGNPIDLIASATPAQYERAIELVGGDPNVDAVVVIYIPPLVTRPEEIAAAIARGAGTLPAATPIAAVYLSAKGTPPALARGPRGPIPSYAFPENAALALAAAARYGRWRARPVSSPARLSPDQEQAVRGWLGAFRARQPAGGWVDLDALAELLALVGIELARFRRTAVDQEAIVSAAIELGLPVALKAEAAGLVHKSDVGGVALGLESPDAVRRAATRMCERLRAHGLEPSGFVVQRQLPAGVEAMVGVVSDPSLGPLVVAGLGGVAVELLHDVGFRLTPLAAVDAEELLDGLRGRALLDGFRGAPPADRAALTQLVLAVSALVEVLPELAELDLNPVVVRPRGEGAIAVDARMRLEFAPAETVQVLQPPTPPRRELPTPAS